MSKSLAPRAVRLAGRPTTAEDLEKALAHLPKIKASAEKLYSIANEGGSLPFDSIAEIVDVATRFWCQVADTEKGCWEWLGVRNPNGYGSFSFRKSPFIAHRMAYLLEHGKLPEKLFVCHQCDNPGCVNPAHLFIGTASDNVQDMLAKGRHHQQKKDQCKHGHAFTKGNTLQRFSATGAPRRECKACQMTRNRRRQTDACCLRGHMLNEENSYFDKLERRRCRQCAEDREAERNRKTAEKQRDQEAKRQQREQARRQAAELREKRCLQGHEMTPENRGQSKRGVYCLACARIKRDIKRAALKAGVVPAMKKYCRKGHPLTPENAVITPTGPVCKECKQAFEQRRKACPPALTKSHCLHGHALSTDNVFLDHGAWGCKACKRAAQARSRAKRKAAQLS